MHKQSGGGGFWILKPTVDSSRSSPYSNYKEMNWLEQVSPFSIVSVAHSKPIFLLITLNCSSQFSKPNINNYANLIIFPMSISRIEKYNGINSKRILPVRINIYPNSETFTNVVVAVLEIGMWKLENGMRHSLDSAQYKSYKKTESSAHSSVLVIQVNGVNIPLESLSDIPISNFIILKILNLDRLFLSTIMRDIKGKTDRISAKSLTRVTLCCTNVNKLNLITFNESVVNFKSKIRTLTDFNNDYASNQPSIPYLHKLLCAKRAERDSRYYGR